MKHTPAKRALSSFLLFGFVSFAVACGSTGQKQVEVPFTATGTAANAFEAGDWTVELEKASLGIGPIYFCAATGTSGDLCPTAVAEFASSAEIDALDSDSQALRPIAALSGEVHSVAWDFAITWPATEANAVPLEGAPGGHSARFKGHATRGGVAVDFVADIDITPQREGTHAVQGVRINATIAESGTRCEIEVDPTLWWSQVDFDELSTATDMPVVLTVDSNAYQALVLAMTSNAPPTFKWSGR
jgi:hypothetical protein